MRCNLESHSSFYIGINWPATDLLLLVMTDLNYMSVFANDFEQTVR
jgi:hypothetical protein